jgi:hypothetical protein
MLITTCSPLPAARASARRSEPGSRPLAVEMSVLWSRIAPGFGALPIECNGAQASPPAKLTSCRCFHASR